MLVQELTATGRWLFRWRSYLPILMIPLLATGLFVFRYPDGLHSLDLEWEGLCLCISLLGVLVRVLTVGFVAHGSSGRGTKTMGAEILNTTGLYSVVRHPLYLGNFLVTLGILLDVEKAYVAVIGTLIFWLYYERIMLAEEALLASTHGDEFRRWAASTPAFIPRLSQWRPPSLPFSARTALRREYSTVFMIVCVFTVIEVAGDLEVLHRLKFDPIWEAIFITACAGYLLVRSLAKNTRALHVKGRY